MNKIIITPDDVASTGASFQQTFKNSPVIPLGWRLLTGLLILMPPLLFGVTIAGLVISRRKVLTVRYAYTLHYCHLLLVSGILWMCIAAAALALRTNDTTPKSSLNTSAVSFSAEPKVPSTHALSGKEIVQNLSPLVVVVRQEGSLFLNDQACGAGAIVSADDRGCLILTSRHVIDAICRDDDQNQVVQISAQDGQQAIARVVGIHQSLDLALLLVRREAATAEFVQPVREYAGIEIGEQVFVIGHPEGLEFSISNGLISQKRSKELLQISAPISPGNSGGPVYDNRGCLVGIVQCVLDKTRHPNAENLNFAVRADVLQNSEDWVLAETDKAMISGLASKLAELRNASNQTIKHE